MRSFVFCLLLAVQTLYVEGQSLEECRRLAREHYPEISQYGLIAQTEQYDLSNAAKAWIPQVSLSGQATWQSATPTYPEIFGAILSEKGVDMSGIRKDQYKVAVDISQTLWDGGQSKVNRALIDAEAAEQRHRVDVDLYALQSRVDDLYFGILLLDERVAQTQAQIVLLENNLSRIRTCLRNGVAMQSDVDAVEAELLSARQTMLQVEASRASYRRMLEIFIGRPLDQVRLERPAMPEVADRSLRRPELGLLDAQAQTIDIRRRAITSSLMPRFSAFAQGYYGYPGLDMFKSMMSPGWTVNAMVGVRMSWNIGAFYTKRNSLGKLNAAQRQIDIRRDVFAFNTRLQTAQEEGEIERLRQVIESDGQIVELRRSVRMAAESQLENGVIETTDLLRKITEETSAALNRSTHEIELLKTIYELKYVLNQ